MITTSSENDSVRVVTVAVAVAGSERVAETSVEVSGRSDVTDMDVPLIRPGKARGSQEFRDRFEFENRDRSHGA
jgi:hypothetical protein